jgi:hypothetical protein
VLPAAARAALLRHPLPYDAVRGMYRDGRITARLRDELIAWLDEWAKHRSRNPR